MSARGSAKVKKILVPFLGHASVLAALAERISSYLREKDYLEDEYRGLRAMREAWSRDRQSIDVLEQKLRAILDAEREDIREDIKPDLEDGDRQAYTYRAVLLILDAEAVVARGSVAPPKLSSLIGKLDDARNALRELEAGRPSTRIFNSLSGTIGALKQMRRTLEKSAQERRPGEVERHVAAFYSESRRLLRGLGYLTR